MFGRSFRVARLGGIDIEIHPSWLIILALVAYTLSESVFPDLYDDWSTAAYWMVVDHPYAAVTDADGKFTILYTDEDFVILGRDNETRVRVGHAGGTIYLDNADYILELIDEQRREYSINPEDNLYLPLIPARDIPEVREWVRTFVPLPKEAPLASVSLKGHRLAKALPTIGRPIWKNPDFVICDTGNDTVSVTFKTHESTGTKHYLEAAAAQVLDLVRSAKASPLSEDRLVRLLRNHVGSDLAPSFRR